jgi:glycosyltransferase involved in cell wall biosynthesis
MKRNLLMIAPYLPYPPVSGGRVRTYNLIKSLKDEWDITLACFVKPNELTTDVDYLKEFCANIYTFPRRSSPGLCELLKMTLTSLHPIYQQIHTSKLAKNTISTLLQHNHYDVIHVESYYMMQNLPITKVSLLLSETNIEFLAMKRLAPYSRDLMRRIIFEIDWRKQKRQEIKEWRISNLCTMVSEVDASLASNIEPRVWFDIVPNGVESEFVEYKLNEKMGTQIVFIGNYHGMPNVDAAIFLVKEIFPLVKREVPLATLLIVGQDPTREILELAKEPGVRVIGFVEDIRPLIAESAIVACPIRFGSGTRIKILQAMALGKSVVSTYVGCEGLDVRDKIDLLIADGAHDFAKAIISCLTNQELRTRLGQNAREKVRKHYLWHKSALKLSDCYMSIIAK